jgi:hypothetical protein
MPAATMYAPFAQDTLYTVFFTAALLLTWQCATSQRLPVARAAVLGAVFFCLTMLNYSWCLATTMFAAFAGAMAVRRRWRPIDVAARGILPLAVMTLLLAAVLVRFRYDYVAHFLAARAYVAGEWYRLTGLYQWLMALAGGQLELLLMAGAVTGSAILVTPARLRRGGGSDPAARQLAVVLAVYAVPLLLGPYALKMETARCWTWTLAVPLCMAAGTLLDRPRPRAFAAGAVAVSIATTAILRSFLNFAP